MRDIGIAGSTVSAGAHRASTAGAPASASPQTASIAIFDLDETITRSDTFLRFLIGGLLRSPTRWHVTPLLAWAVLMFATGRRDNSWLKSFFLRRIVGGRPQRATRAWAERYVERVLQRQVLPAAQAELVRLRARGVRLVLASASPDLYVESLGRRLGFEHVICTRVARLGDGRCSGGLDGGNCYGAEKRRRVEQYLAGCDAGLHEIAFYSDHHSDWPLFEAAGQRFAVNPTPKLAELARRHGIAILQWRR